MQLAADLAVELVDIRRAVALLAAPLALPPANGLRRWAHHYLFGLIAVTGMRLSEAIGLERSVVDFTTAC